MFNSAPINIRCLKCVLKYNYVCIIFCCGFRNKEEKEKEMKEEEKEKKKRGNPIFLVSFLIIYQLYI